MDEIKVFTHDDLDGFGCGYVISKIPSVDEVVDISYEQPNTINDSVKKFLDTGEYKKYNNIFITDLSVNDEVSAQINELVIYDGVNIALIDHHKSALRLNDNIWCYVSECDDSGRKHSATKLVYERVRANLTHNTSLCDFLGRFVHDVSDYDTYNWKDDNNITPHHINMIYKFYKNERFRDHMDKVLASGDYYNILGDTEKMIISIMEANTKTFFEWKEKTMVVKDILGFKAGVVFAENTISELGNHLSKNNPDLYFIAIINLSGNHVSYRTVKSNINLFDEVASMYKGGGHQKSAGSPIDNKEAIDTLIKSIFAK